MLIIHRCTKCGHPKTWGNGTVCAGYNAGCPCNQGSRGRCQYNPVPETTGRFLVDRTPVTEVLMPGTSEAGYSTACDCEACRALYLELTGREVPVAA